MKRGHSSIITFKIFLLAVFYSLVSACGGGGGGGSTSVSPAGTGSVALLLTDAPSDIFEEININVIKAELLSDDGRVTIFQGDRTFNLLDLTDAKMFAVRDDVPAGTYNKIRLTLTSMELVDYNGTPDDTTDDLKYYPKLPGNGKLDLNPRGDFDVAPGGTLVIQIDMDAQKSIHYVAANGKYQFRPVVFVDIVTDSFKERYVKLHGTVQDIDNDNREFELCDPSIPVQIDDNNRDSDSRGCVDVIVTDNTAIFDVNGMPAMFGDLVEGDQATVFGRLRRERDDDDDDGDDEVVKDVELVASLIEIGDKFLKISGQALTDVDSSDQFSMDVDAGQGVVTPNCSLASLSDCLAVQLQTGTRIIDRKGQALSKSDIYNGKLVSVRGVLDLNTKTLYASLVLVDMDTSTQLSGTVGANPDSTCGFTLTDDSPLTDASGDFSVATDSSTQVYLVTATSSSGSSVPIAVGDLVSGQRADVFGNFNNGCFDAHTIIAYELAPSL